MAEKLASYTGGLHVFKNYLKDRWGDVKENATAEGIQGIKEKTNKKVDDFADKAIVHFNKGEGTDYSHIYQ